MKAPPSARLLCLLVIGLALLSSSSVHAKNDPKKFQAALNSVSNQCKLACGICFVRSDKVTKLVADGKFCEMMNLVDAKGVSTKACLTAKDGCSTDEFNKIEEAACGSTSLVVSLAAVVIGVVASMLGK